MSVASSSPMQTSPSARAVRSPAGVGWMLLLAALAAVSRLWLLGNDPGEADCARFLIGLHRWIRLGPHATAMYGSVFSPLYYWLAAHLTHAAGMEPLRGARLLSGLSAVAAIATAPVAYALGCRLVSPRIAFWATLAFLATPALWWLGIEPHPQGLSLLGFLLALLCLAIRLQDDPPTGRARLLLLAGIAALTFGLGCKSDLILLFGAFPALLPALRPDLFVAAAGDGRTWTRNWRRWWPELQTALLPPVVASLLFLVLRSLILQHGFVWLQHNSDHAVAAFLEWPRGGQLIKQLLPMATAFGILIALVTALGILRAGFRRWSESGATAPNLLAAPSPHERSSWGPRPVGRCGRASIPGNPGSPEHAVCVLGWNGRPLCSWRLQVAAPGRLALLVGMWVLPSLLFWFLIRGNNVRHMADILLPLLWLGLAGWEDLRWPILPMLVTAALLLDLWIIPPSSNLTLYPSANVPESAHALHLRIEDLRDNLANGLSGAQGPVCYLGNATLPYLELLLWNTHPDATFTQQDDNSTLMLANGRRVHFIEVNSSSQYRRAAAGCPRTQSLEYGANGAHQWFLGQEWGSLPFHQRWYSVRYQRGR